MSLRTDYETKMVERTFKVSTYVCDWCGAEAEAFEEAKALGWIMCMPASARTAGHTIEKHICAECWESKKPEEKS